MNTYSHIATSSKLLETKGFFCLEDAQKQADEWNALAPLNANDAECEACVYTREEWIRICE